MRSAVPAEGRPNESTAHTLKHETPVGSSIEMLSVPPAGAVQKRRRNLCGSDGQLLDEAATNNSGCLTSDDRKAGTAAEEGRRKLIRNRWETRVVSTRSPVGAAMPA
jgi:hypothetical protein